MNSIKKRLVVNFMFVIIITVVILEIFLISIIKQHYYKGLEDNLYNQLLISSDLYSRYFSDASLEENILNNVDSFWKQTSAQVQILDLEGNVLMDSIGIAPASLIDNEDVKKALLGQKGRWVGMVDYDTVAVMSVAYPLMARGEIVGVLRFISTLREVQKEVQRIALLFIAFGGLVILISGFVGFILANTIVGPLKQVTLAAEKMALGDFKAKSDVKVKDEIGKLSNTLNYMASEIVKKEQLKNDFISSVSHELRTPLTSIKGWAITLKNGFEDKEMLADGLDIIEKESDRLTQMVEELLDFSKFISEKSELDYEEVNISNVMEHIKKQLTPRAVRDNISFEVECSQQMPSTYTDENKLKQIFINLLDNAFKFTPQGGRVLFTAEFKNNEFIFKVKDTGSGISQEELPKIKEKFYKGKSSKSSNGIGLSICDEIIRLMKGQFHIYSELNSGTEAIVKLPLREGKTT